MPDTFCIAKQNIGQLHDVGHKHQFPPDFVPAGHIPDWIPRPHFSGQAVHIDAGSNPMGAMEVFVDAGAVVTDMPILGEPTPSKQFFCVFFLLAAGDFNLSSNDSFDKLQRKVIAKVDKIFLLPIIKRDTIFLW